MCTMSEDVMTTSPPPGENAYNRNMSAHITAYMAVLLLCDDVHVTGCFCDQDFVNVFAAMCTLYVEAKSADETMRSLYNDFDGILEDVQNTHFKDFMLKNVKGMYAVKGTYADVMGEVRRFTKVDTGVKPWDRCVPNEYMGWVDDYPKHVLEIVRDGVLPVTMLAMVVDGRMIRSISGHDKTIGKPMILVDPENCDARAVIGMLCVDSVNVIIYVKQGAPDVLSDICCVLADDEYNDMYKQPGMQHVVSIRLELEDVVYYRTQLQRMLMTAFDDQDPTSSRSGSCTTARDTPTRRVRSAQRTRGTGRWATSSSTRLMGTPSHSTLCVTVLSSSTP